MFTESCACRPESQRRCYNCRAAPRRGTRGSACRISRACNDGLHLRRPFHARLLLDSVETELLRIARETANLRLAAVIGAPIRCADKLYNCAVVISRGVILAVVPKTHMPNYGEFYELRHFAVPSRTELGAAAPYIDSLQTFFNPDGCIFSCTDYPDFRFGIEICEDLWVASPPSDKLAAAGALVIVNCSAGDEIIGKADYRKRITEVQSAKNICAYLYCGAGEGESTSDMVFSGHCFAYENGTLLAEKAPFDYANDMLITEIDLGRLLYRQAPREQLLRGQCCPFRSFR